MGAAMALAQTLDRRRKARKMMATGQPMRFKSQAIAAARKKAQTESQRFHRRRKRWV
jgi:hypothetical protein